MRYFKVDDELMRVSDMACVDVSRVENLHVRVTMQDGRQHVLEGPTAVELVMLVCPSALEGRRLRWARNAWVIHNLIGHPGMQILSWLGLSKLGLQLHEAMVPRPAVIAERSWMP